MKKTNTIIVQNIPIHIASEISEDYICITDMANAKESESRAADIIKNWLRARYTLEFLGTWEQIYNPNFKVVEFDHFKMQAGFKILVLANLESLNAEFIKMGIQQRERLIKLNLTAISQLKSLSINSNIKKLKE